MGGIYEGKTLKDRQSRLESLCKYEEKDSYVVV